MTENKAGLESHNNQEANTSPVSSDKQQKGETVMVQGTKFTKEEIAEANKPQPNVILDILEDSNTSTTRDNERVNPRANEAPDSTDTNSGGMISGGAKGVNQS